MSRSASLLVLDYLVIGAIGGICTVIAAHAWSPYAVGTFSALGGVASLLSTMSNTGLASTVTRYLGESDNQLDFVLQALVLSVTTGLVLSAAVCFVPGHFGVPIRDLPASIGAIFALFAGYVVCNNLTAVTDPAFVARKQVSFAVAKDISASVVRVLVLIVFIGTDAVGLFAAFVAYVAVAGVMDIGLIAWKLRNSHPRGRLLRFRHIGSRWRFALTSHSAALVSSAPAALLATIAAAFDGPVRAAEVTIPITVAAYLSVIPSMTSQAVLADLADPAKDAAQVGARALRLCYAPMIPAAAVLALSAPYVLLIFGHRYANNGADYLRWDCLSALLSVSNYITDTVILAREKMLAYNVVNGLGAASMLACFVSAGALGPYWFGPAPVLGQLLYLTFSVAAVLCYATPSRVLLTLRSLITPSHR